MLNSKTQLYFLLALLSGTFVIVFFIFLPFFYALVLAIVSCVVFQPFYERTLHYTRGRKGIAAFLTILAVTILVFTPLTFLGVQIFQEAKQLYLFLTENGGENTIANVVEGLTNDFPMLFSVSPEFSFNSDQYFQQGLSWLLGHLGGIFSNFVKLIVSSFMFLISFYYLLKDGKKFKKALAALSPLADADNEMIFKKLEMAVNSVVRGRLAIAVIQGALAAIGFVLFGVPNPVLWATATTVVALIPGIGTALVVIPAVIFLFLRGDNFAALGLLIWGMAVVGLIDNFLGPKLVGRGTQLHPLIIFLSVFGGIGFFGPLGFLLGPLTLSFLFVLLDVYANLVRAKA